MEGGSPKRALKASVDSSKTLFDTRLKIHLKISLDMDDPICQICKQQYEEPRLLNCFHSFCTKCLLVKKISSASNSRQASLQEDDYSSLENDTNSPIFYRHSVQKVVCPICDAETFLEKRGIQGLPINCVLEHKIALSRYKMPPCELCTPSEPAHSKCEQCDIFLCALCMDSHMKFADTSQHSFSHLNAKQEIRKHKCPNHAPQELNYFCIACEEIMCFTCCTLAHTNHKYETVAKAAEHFSSRILNALEKAAPMVKNCNRSIENIKMLDNKVTGKCNDVEREMDGFIQAYKEALDEHMQGLMQQLTTIRNSRRQVLINQQDVLTKKVKNCLSAIEFAEELVKLSPVELLTISPYILDKLDITDDSDLQQLSIRVSDIVQFLPEEKAPSIGKYQLFGIISTQVISPEHCTLEIEGMLSCRQHKKASFKLTTKDSNNKILCHGGEKIITELRYRDATQRSLPVTIIDEGDGTYVLNFKPDASGNLDLNVLIRNTHIQGSPFKVCVSTLRPHKGVYHCCSFCSSGGNKSAKCGCGGKMPGGYKGCGHGHVGHPGRRHWSCCGNVLQNSECSGPITYQYSF